MGFPLTPFRGDKGLDKTKPFFVCDIEAYKWKLFRVIGHYDGENFKYFKKLDDYFNFISSDGEDKQIFAHFGGIYDFNFLLDWILVRDKEKRFRIKTIVPRGSAILCFDVFYDYIDEGIKREVKLSFNDSSAMLAFGLKSLTNSFGVKHKKKEFDFDKWDGKVTPEVIDYLKDDCRGLYEVISEYRNWNLVRRAGHSSTTASQALKIYRCFMKNDIYPLSKSADEFTRKAYFGGRVEIFKPYFSSTKNERLKNYDVNSLYPFTMLNNTYPTGFKSVVFGKYIDDQPGIFHVDVEVPDDMYIPVLGTNLLVPGVRQDTDAKGNIIEFETNTPKLVFPTGKFSGHWTNAELEYAKSLGVKVTKVHSGYIFKDGGEIFKNYINTLYDMRMTAKASGDGVSDVLCKLLMNSLYGRFGMTTEKENIAVEYGQDYSSEVWRQLKTDLGEDVYLVKREVELKSFTNSAISCFVTSFSRIHMHKQYMKLDNKLWYTDTDSLFTTKKISASSELGGLKLEYESDKACFILPKTYMVESTKAGELMKKITMKGFERRKIQQFTMENFESALEGELKALTAKNSAKFCRFKTALGKGQFLSMMGEQERTIRSKYDKRRVIKDSNGNYDTIPLHIENGSVVN